MTASGSNPATEATHAWFDGNSGWAPPDPESLADWAREGACRSPDGCWVQQRGTCLHGLVSWQVVLDELAEIDRRRPPPGAPQATGAIP